MNWAMRKHDVSGGGLCTDGGDGCCVECGVSMATCPKCRGIGFHFDGCVDGDRDIEAAWPKQCACGRSYTAHEWSLLELAGTMVDDVEALELRNCAGCRSTIAQVVE